MGQELAPDRAQNQGEPLQNQKADELCAGVRVNICNQLPAMGTDQSEQMLAGRDQYGHLDTYQLNMNPGFISYYCLSCQFLLLRLDTFPLSEAWKQPSIPP